MVLNAVDVVIQNLKLEKISLVLVISVHTKSPLRQLPFFMKSSSASARLFFIVFEMATSTKSLSVSYVSVRFGVTEKIARLFMHKVWEAMESSGNHPMGANVHGDEFVLGGREKVQVGRSYKAKKK